MSTPEERIKAAREALDSLRDMQNEAESSGSPSGYDFPLSEAENEYRARLEEAVDDLFAAVDERDALRKTLEDYKGARQVLRKALVDMVGSDDVEELENMASYLKISKDPSAQEKELMFRAIEALNKTRE